MKGCFLCCCGVELTPSFWKEHQHPGSEMSHHWKQHSLKQSSAEQNNFRKDHTQLLGQVEKANLIQKKMKVMFQCHWNILPDVSCGEMMGSKIGKALRDPQWQLHEHMKSDLKFLTGPHKQLCFHVSLIIYIKKKKERKKKEEEEEIKCCYCGSGCLHVCVYFKTI